MSDLETTIASLEQLVTEYADGSRESVDAAEVEQLVGELSRLAPKTTQVAALLSQIKHLAPVVLKLRAQKRFAEIDMGKRRLLEDCERLRDVVLVIDV